MDKCESAVFFNPPLWQQRRSLSNEILKKHGIETVLDLGCGEGALLQILLNDTSYRHLSGVDILPDEINTAVLQCRPSQRDMIYLREKPISLDLYLGSLLKPDDRLLGHEAITCLEVIEHLPLVEIPLLSSVIFQDYRPRLVIASTPNAEFNIHFENLKHGAYRHWDHKFEWNRIEFESWAKDCCHRWGYNVEFTGVGAPPKGTSLSTGYCTQMAVFTRLPDIHPSRIIYGTPLTLIEHIDFPYFADAGSATPTTVLATLRSLTARFIEFDETWRIQESLDPETILSGAEFHHALVTLWGTLPFKPILLERYWNDLGVRQMTGSVGRLVEILNSKEGMELFRMDEIASGVSLEEAVICPLFNIPPPVEADEDSLSSDSWGSSRTSDEGSSSSSP